VALNLGDSTIGATPLGAIEAPAVEHLLELLDRPPWQRDALCREYAGRVNWFPGRGESTEDAKAVCRRCLVRPECLLDALEHDEPNGVWGGLSAQERREVLRVARAS
jgi:WhiB family redox-sensing transcriptional regulator